MAPVEHSLAWIERWDQKLCLRLNRAGRIAWVRGLFRAISRLGDGLFWYALMLALLAVEGAAALLPVMHLLAAGMICTVLYKRIKARTSRPRPFRAHPDIVCRGVALDAFSFPSGHTLHAVAFSLIALSYYPFLLPLLLPFTLLVAASRLVLGLHYPSDVLAGATIGAGIAGLTLVF